MFWWAFDGVFSVPISLSVRRTVKDPPLCEQPALSPYMSVMGVRGLTRWP